MSSELLRIEFRVILLDRDDDGLPVGERPIAEGAVYPGALDKLPDEIRRLADQAITPSA